MVNKRTSINTRLLSAMIGIKRKRRDDISKARENQRQNKRPHQFTVYERFFSEFEFVMSNEPAPVSWVFPYFLIMAASVTRI